jgi:hypothetical protein
LATAEEERPLWPREGREEAGALELAEEAAGLPSWRCGGSAADAPIEELRHHESTTGKRE